MKLKLPLLPSLLLSPYQVNSMRPRNDLATTAPASVLQQNPGCALVSSTLFKCESISPGFTSLVPSAQAQCLCYDSSKWIPTIFDKAVQTCADFASTAVPSAYPAFVNLEGFCGNIGNIMTTMRPATISPITTFESLIPTTTIRSVIPACYTALSLIQFCAGLVPGFMTLGSSQQASCLCYASVTSWIPKSFDNAMETCSQFAQSESGIAGLVSSVDIFNGICESVGDVWTMGGQVSSMAISHSITSSDVGLAPSTSISSPSPASIPGFTSSAISTIAIHSSTQNTRSIVKTISVTTISRSMTSTTSVPGSGAIDTSQDGNIELKDVSDQMVILISFACAALVLFLC
ncbi:hypothetical protein BCIN_05g08300 [Botrytis cinerea B05.10]|uniref:Uncharacterized protein n=3 Tax=Botryotinia fuckeliana TaxID=40559 RepID=A0A384JJ38_BOTFB|nr:hypothetical protein BCIN_05g08300 [Botrytis cinerea B05.10]ATZ50482.1 hypothetical protein BCIN_05g08300 [Botrytis cinerea B05.10]EMR82761.1 hypothetical protein BcDW1_8590 [Botrytis cinerea BcDW1]CCD34356.1 hypothetical protein BofuT4_P103160.1 [Botrytis cinerea T4]